MKNSRFIIGIDLGTTNIAVTFSDLESGNSALQLMKIPQVIAPGEIDELSLFPSFAYLFDEKIYKKETLNPPWCSGNSYCAGLYAREHGSALPGRFISSAKSWLCHSGVERKEKILPWGGIIENLKRSPLDVTSYYLSHIRDAWNHKYGRLKDSEGNPSVFEEQSIIITIPASFDEVARELTIEAAKIAGLKNMMLLEEPLAAFYSWLDLNLETYEETIARGEKILVVDIGGGTTDFSIIELNHNGALERTLSGNHLLLGGDNIDIAIARKIEEHWKTTLTHGQWLNLCQKTRYAKENLLNNQESESVQITLLAQGSRIIEGSRKYTLIRKELYSLLMDGFFGKIDVSAAAPQRKKGIQTMGLPYESDPSITLHLLSFLKYAQKMLNPGENSALPLRPDKILFNGGVLIPPILRERIKECLNSWFSSFKITELTSRDFTLAVAYGASYFGRAKAKGGVKVKTASTRSYYIEVFSENNASGKLLCVLPRGADENKAVHTPGEFSLETNKRVNFPLYSSSVRVLDKQGDYAENSEDFTFLTSLVSMLKYGKSNEHRTLDVEISSKLNESGALKLELASIKTPNKWPLKFDVRVLGASEEGSLIVGEQLTFESSVLDRTSAVIMSGFSSDTEPVKEIEKITGSSRDEWPLGFLRHLADVMLKYDYKQLKNPLAEARWLNLCGYALRPGFGDPEDELRMRKAWQIWSMGVNNPGSAEVNAQWWIFWRRIISGLKAGHQLSLYNEIAKELFPKNIYQQRVKSGEQAKAEMYRALGALELLPGRQKAIVGDMLVQRAKKLLPYEYYFLARAGARRLFSGRANNVLPPAIAEKWLISLIKDESVSGDKLFAISRIAALTSDRAINLSDKIVSEAKAFMLKSKAPEKWIEHLEKVVSDNLQEESKVFGDTIPLGLKIV